MFFCFIAVHAQEQRIVQFSPDFLELMQARNQEYIKPPSITPKKTGETKEKPLTLSICVKIRAAVVLYALYASGVNAYQLYRNLNVNEHSVSQLLGVQNIAAYAQFGFEMAKVIVLLIGSNYLYKLFIIDK